MRGKAENPTGSRPRALEQQRECERGRRVRQLEQRIIEREHEQRGAPLLNRQLCFWVFLRQEYTIAATAYGYVMTDS